MTGTEFPDGSLRLFGLIGGPIAQVRACYPVTERMRQAGANAALVPLHVPAAHLPEIVRSLGRIGNFDGFVVTVPHKIPMAGLVDKLSERARLIGAINLARREADGRWHGDIADGVGFRRGLDATGFDPAGRTAFIVGAGGAGSAVAIELARSGARLRIFNTAAERAISLAQRLRDAGFDATASTDPQPSGSSLVVNATPLGMRPEDPMPIDPALLTPDMTVAEVVMKPLVTAFLRAAQERGCQIQLGEAVLEFRLETMVEFLVGAHAHGFSSLKRRLYRLDLLK